jgi:mono/diheme cytochrome c family protein
MIQMPAWAAQLSDAQIAAILSYIRSHWNNHGSNVTAAEVTALKQ